MDVLELRQFYASPLGRQVRRLLARRLAALPAPPAEARVLGLGFATPWLDAWRERAGATFAFMPAHQGALRWPASGAAATALVDEGALPLPDACIDMALVVHALELTPAREAMLRELWRVLAPSGHAVFIVPNRTGPWAGSDSVPFGHGRPFSRGQLERLLQEAMFTPVRMEPVLFMPPWKNRLLRSSPATWERVGRVLWPGFSGLILAEAVKQVYARRPLKARPVLLPELHPAPAAPAGVPRDGA
jgi:SAM-dependent methyltransferase